MIPQSLARIFAIDPWTEFLGFGLRASGVWRLGLGIKVFGVWV